MKAQALGTALALGFCIVATPNAAAQLEGTEAPIFIPSTATHVGVGSGSETVGYAFTLDFERIVTHLGIFDRDKNSSNIVPDRIIGIWNSNGDLLVQATLVFDDAIPDPAQVLHTPRYVALDVPVVLTEGDYVIGAWYRPTTLPVNPAPEPNPGQNLPGISFDYSELELIPGFHLGPTLRTDNLDAFGLPTVTPLDPRPGNEGLPLPHGYFGPIMRFQVIPEPATVMVMLISGVGLMFRRRV